MDNLFYKTSKHFYLKSGPENAQFPPPNIQWQMSQEIQGYSEEHWLVCSYDQDIDPTFVSSTNVLQNYLYKNFRTYIYESWIIVFIRIWIPNYLNLDPITCLLLFFCFAVRVLMRNESWQWVVVVIPEEWPQKWTSDWNWRKYNYMWPKHTLKNKSWEH